jgi:hypothetical protein
VRVDAVEAALQNTRSGLLGASNASAFLERSKMLVKATDDRDGVIPFKSDADKGTDDLVTYLKDHVLAEGNLESEDATSATYLMRPSVVCKANDTSCADYVTKHPIRLVLSTPAAGDVDVAFLYSDARYNPVTLRLYRNSLGIAIDLGASADTIRGLTDGSNLPDTLQGVVLFELVKNAELDYSFRVSVTRDIAVGVTRDGKRYEFGLAATSPTWEVRADGNAHTLGFIENFGAMRGKVPLSAFADSVFDLGLDKPTSADPIDLLLSGITANATLNDADDVVHVKGIGLGASTSYVKEGQNVLFSLDLNAASERRFDLDVSLDADDRALLEVSPGFDLSLGFAFSQIADRVRGIPTYALNDTIGVVLAGAARPAVKSVSGPAGSALSVVSGSLSLTSRTAPQNDVTVTAGQCLLDGASPPGESHPLSSLEAGACP